MDTVTIGIIGGTGQMGRWFERFFTQNGHRVLIAGRKTALSYSELGRRSDIVMLSVPLEAAVAVCSEIGPLLAAEQMLVDICSLKERVLDAMLAATPAQVAGTHPLFGPSAESLKGQNIVSCPGRGSAGLTWLETIFSAGGAVLTRMDPAEHDRHMAVVQALMHFLTITWGRTLQKLDLRPQQALKVATPVFRTQLDLIGRMFAQDLTLYRDLIRNNPYAENTLTTFMAALEESRRELGPAGPEGEGNGDHFMQHICDFLGPFCEQGLKESNRFINALYSEF